MQVDGTLWELINDSFQNLWKDRNISRVETKWDAQKQGKAIENYMTDRSKGYIFNIKILDIWKQLSKNSQKKLMLVIKNYLNLYLETLKTC